MKSTTIAIIGLMIAACAGLVLAQTRPENPFGIRRTIGESPPDNFIVEPGSDRLIRVGRSAIRLENAATFDDALTLAIDGTIYATAVSHNARTIAVAVDRRIELWSLETGDLLTSIEPPATNTIAAPLMFSDDDSYLSFTAVVPASQATRRSENDTDLLPWVWDIDAALDLGDSRLPGRVDAYSFFDNRAGGLFLGPNNILLAAIVGQYQLIDLEASSLTPFRTFNSGRFENDPISLWFSAAGDLMYVRDRDSSTVIQVDTRTRDVWGIQPGQSYRAGGFYGVPGNQARVIGAANSHTVNPLIRTIFNYDYRSDWNYHPLTISLLDVLSPVTESADTTMLLLGIADDEAGTTTVEMLTPANGEQIAIDEAWTRLALRELSGGAVTVYDLNTGVPLLRFTPEIALGDRGGETPFSFTANGEALIAGYARYDSRTGAALIDDREQINGFERYHFSADSTQVVTFAGDTWRVWDVATGALLRTETLVYGAATVRAVANDGRRVLLDAFIDGRQALTVYDIGADSRTSVAFDAPPDMSIIDITPNSDWTNFLIRYAPNGDSPHGSAGALAIYNLTDGLRTFIAGADLPPGAGEYGWIDATTAFMAGDSAYGNAPDRIFGVEYAANGVPACLLERYPGRADSWQLLWERLTYYRAPDDLARLALAACAAGDAEAVEALYTPTPNSTSQPNATAVVSRIAGVPACLTGNFSEQAIAYAREWRQLTDGLSEEQIADLSELLCAGLTGEFAGGYAPRVGVVDTRVLYAIDAADGRRTRIAARLLRSDADAAALEFFIDLYYRVTDRTLSNPILSPDRRWLAQSGGGTIELIEITIPYETLTQNATATVVATLGAQPNVIRVLPTSTPPPQSVGLPQPTLTPTIIPTFIPLPEETVIFTGAGDVEEICPNSDAVPFAARSASFQPVGRLIGTAYNEPIPAVLDMTTGQLTLDDSIPPCQFGLPCELSLDQRWMLINDGAVRVMRPDGSEAVTLFTAEEAASVLESVNWHDRNRVRIQIRRFVPEELREPRTFIQYYDVRDGSFSVPELPPPASQINDLPTEIVSRQPEGGVWRVVSTPIRLPEGTGYRYYLVNRDDGTVEYFAGVGANETIEFSWHPFGDWLMYSVPNAPYAYRFDPNTRDHRALDFSVHGSYSRDGRMRLGAFYLDYEPLQARIETGAAIPTLRLQDDATGVVRLYCAPAEWRDFQDTAWSEDGRYLALRAALPGNQSEQSQAYLTVYILDTETGEVVDMGVNMTGFFAWTADAGETP